MKMKMKNSIKLTKQMRFLWYTSIGPHVPLFGLQQEAHNLLGLDLLLNMANLLVGLHLESEENSVETKSRNNTKDIRDILSMVLLDRARVKKRVFSLPSIAASTPAKPFH